MKRFLTILLVLVVGVAFAMPTLAQEANDFDIWDFATHPPTLQWDGTYPPTRASVLSNMTSYLTFTIMEEIDSYILMSTTKLALMAHSPSSNVATQALLTATIPTGDTAEKEVRYLASFKDEVNRGYSSLVSQVPIWYERSFRWTRDVYQTSVRFRYLVDLPVYTFLRVNHNRALKVADTLAYLDTRGMTAVGTDYEWVRDSARVQLGELGGFTLTGGSKDIHITTRLGQTQRTYTAGSIVKANAIYRLSEARDGIGTATIVAGTAPVKFSIGTSGETTLAGGATRIFSDHELINGVSIRTVAPPVASSVDPQSTSVGDTQTVAFTAFTGEDIVYSVSSSDSGVVSVRKSATPLTLVLSAHKVGIATVTLTGTNGAGSATATFKVVVTSGTGDKE